MKNFNTNLKKGLIPLVCSVALVFAGCTSTNGNKPNDTETMLETRSYTSDSVIHLRDPAVHEGDSVYRADLTVHVEIQANEGPVLQNGEYITMDLVVHSGGSWEIRDHETQPTFTFAPCSSGSEITFKTEVEAVVQNETQAVYHIRLAPQPPLCTDSKVALSGGLIVVVEDNLPTMIELLHVEKVRIWSADGTSQLLSKK